MGMYKFLMSCGHEAKREVADPAKYFNIDREYYSKQGLCDKCWDKLKTDKEKLNEKNDDGGEMNTKKEPRERQLYRAQEKIF